MPRGGFHGGGHGRVSRGRGFPGRGGWFGPWGYDDVIDVEAVEIDPEVEAAPDDAQIDPTDAIATGRGGGGGSARVQRAQARQMQSADDAAPLDAGTPPAPGATAAVQGGAFDRLAHIIAVHEGFWGGVAQRNPDSEVMRLKIIRSNPATYGLSRHIRWLTEEGRYDNTRKLLYIKTIPLRL